jgi:hypothetical protein
MTNARESLEKRLGRLLKWNDRCARLLDREMSSLEDLYRRSLAEIEAEKQAATDDFKIKEEQIKASVDAAGKEFQLEKYRMEKEKAAAKADQELIDGEQTQVQRRASAELARLAEERTNFMVTWERQKSALNDVYQEKKRHLLVTRSNLLRDVQAAEAKIKKAKERAAFELGQANEIGAKGLNALTQQADGKKQGWAVARETMRKELDAATSERDNMTTRLNELRADKEKELEAARQAMLLAKEQLDIDKATLIEKAEEDQRACEAEVKDLQERLATAEREFQDLVSEHDKRKKDAEEAFEREESILKDAVKTESDKRDYEQKLFEQEKESKEKEIARLREDLEKRTYQWDNQIRSLLLQKSVQDSEHDAERLRTDRDARTALRALEARRAELQQRLTDVKARHAALEANAKKELDVIGQRWHFRRDRLWTLWQTRLDTLKKERQALQDGIDALHTAFVREKRRSEELEASHGERVQELDRYLLTSMDSRRSDKKQRQIQFELEKTRVLAQIKECETLVSEWSDRLKHTQEEVLKRNTGIIAELGYVDRWYREEEQETETFLRMIRETILLMEDSLARADARDAA